MSVIIDFAIFPMDKGESLSPYVARAIKVINESGLPHKLHLAQPHDRCEPLHFVFDD